MEPKRVENPQYYYKPAPFYYYFDRYHIKMDIIMHRKGAICGASLVLAGLIIMAALMVISNTRNEPARPKCEPQNMVPAQDLSTLKNVHSKDKRTMVNLAAYIQMFDSNFIELRAESVSIREMSHSSGILTIQADCADLHIEYQTAEYDHTLIELHGLKWVLRDGSGGAANGSSTMMSCSIDDQFVHRFSRDSRFSCLGRLAYYCQVNSLDKRGNNYLKPVGQIVFNALELELNGDPATIGHGEFSKFPSAGGCRS